MCADEVSNVTPNTGAASAMVENDNKIISTHSKNLFTFYSPAFLKNKICPNSFGCFKKVKRQATGKILRRTDCQNSFCRC